VAAMTRALAQAGWTADEVDLYEVNEAFACVAMIAMRDLGIPHDKINVHGGATALGHPIGASGARVLATLLSALETHGGRKGVASLCIGGGEATAMAVELVGCNPPRNGEGDHAPSSSLHVVQIFVYSGLLGAIVDHAKDLLIQPPEPMDIIHLVPKQTDKHAPERARIFDRLG
jgi:hypothetical protein